jgi:biopolymer transport protein ExbD
LCVDSNTPHRHVREVMKVCAENGAFNVIFAAYQTE